MNTHSFIRSFKEKINRAAWNNQSGAALILILVLLVMMAAFVPVALKVTTQDMNRTNNYVEARKAFYLAEAGIERAKSVLRTLKDFDPILKGPDNAAGGGDDGTFGTTGTAAFAGSTLAVYDGQNVNKVSGFNGGDYYVRVYNNNEKTGTGTATDDQDHIVVVEATGEVDGTKKTIRAVMRRWILNDEMPSALALVGPSASYKPAGGPRIWAKGYDMTWFNVNRSPGGSCNPGVGTWHYGVGANDDYSWGPGGTKCETRDVTCAAKPAITTEAATYTCDTCSPGPPPPGEYTTGDWEYIVGKHKTQADPETDPPAFGTGTYTVKTSVKSFTAEDAAALRKFIVDEKLYDTKSASGGSLNYGAANTTGVTDAQIVWITGSAVISNSDMTSGAGILIIDGNLTFSGGVDYAGVLLVGVCNEAVCANSKISGLGTSVIWGAVITGDPADGSDAVTGGSSDIVYSCTALNGVFDALAGKNKITVVSWTEI